jgi:hypothetical protein
MTTTKAAKMLVRALLASVLVLLGAAAVAARPAGAEDSAGMGHPATITGHAGSEQREAWGTCHKGPESGMCAARTLPDPPADRLRLVRDERVRITFESDPIPSEISVRWGDGAPTAIDAINPTFTTAAGRGDTELQLHAVWRSGDVVDDADWTFEVTVVQECDRTADAPAGVDASGYDSDHDGVCDGYLIPPTQFVVEDPPLHGDVATTPTTVAPATSTTVASVEPATTIPVEVKGVVIERPAPAASMPVRPLTAAHDRPNAVIAGALALVALLLGAAVLRRRLVAR